MDPTTHEGIATMVTVAATYYDADGNEATPDPAMPLEGDLVEYAGDANSDGLFFVTISDRLVDELAANYDDEGVDFYLSDDCYITICPEDVRAEIGQ